jgi:probable HAF family extracellular repeat protein
MFTAHLMKAICITCVGLVCFEASTSSFADSPSFMGLGDLPGGTIASYATDVSADGSVVVGKGNDSTIGEGFRWTASTGMIGLGNIPNPVSPISKATSISANGQIVAGVGSEAQQSRAVQWTAATGMVDLGSPNPLLSSRAEAVSGDGNTFVGATGTGGVDAGVALRWRPGEGYVPLNPLPPGGNSIAYDVSYDGSVIVGFASAIYAQVIVTTVPVMWTDPQTPILLGDLPGGGIRGSALGVSSNGLVAVGYSDSEEGFQAFRWTAQTGMVGLGDLPGTSFNSLAVDASADGSLIVGRAFGNNGPEAFLWDAIHGMRSLKTVLQTDYGLNLTGWNLNMQILAISDDGETIVGGGTFQGQMQAFRAHLPEPSTLAMLAVGGGLMVRRRRYSK